eukprot:TRINITY_DN15998_c0_g1_i1.p1 TRINITY_DN15998_c0_g1~~TRINITY_DN15998_c0_g1_i1.p1  ORF type:complete len:994 (-),score=97.28 TRINITY_DN15998_c0_g1_i1:131-2860(-)
MNRHVRATLMQGADNALSFARGLGYDILAWRELASGTLPPSHTNSVWKSIERGLSNAMLTYFAIHDPWKSVDVAISNALAMYVEANNAFPVARRKRKVPFAVRSYGFTTAWWANAKPSQLAEPAFPVSTTNQRFEQSYPSWLDDSNVVTIVTPANTTVHFAGGSGRRLYLSNGNLDKSWVTTSRFFESLDQEEAGLMATAFRRVQAALGSRKAALAYVAGVIETAPNKEAALFALQDESAFASCEATVKAEIAQMAEFSDGKLAEWEAAIPEVAEESGNAECGDAESGNACLIATQAIQERDELWAAGTHWMESFIIRNEPYVPPPASATEEEEDPTTTESVEGDQTSESEHHTEEEEEEPEWCPTPTPALRPPEAGMVGEFRLYIANLPVSADQTTIRSRFLPYGQVIFVRVRCSGATSTTSYAFVGLETSERLARQACKHFTGLSWEQFINVSLQSRPTELNFQESEDTESKKDTSVQCSDQDSEAGEEKIEAAESDPESPDESYCEVDWGADATGEGNTSDKASEPPAAPRERRKKAKKGTLYVRFDRVHHRLAGYSLPQSVGGASRASQGSRGRGKRQESGRGRRGRGTVPVATPPAPAAAPTEPAGNGEQPIDPASALLALEKPARLLQISPANVLASAVSRAILQLRREHLSGQPPASSAQSLERRIAGVCNAVVHVDGRELALILRQVHGEWWADRSPWQDLDTMVEDIPKDVSYMIAAGKLTAIMIMRANRVLARNASVKIFSDAPGKIARLLTPILGIRVTIPPSVVLHHLLHSGLLEKVVPTPGSSPLLALKSVLYIPTPDAHPHPRTRVQKTDSSNRHDKSLASQRKARTKVPVKPPVEKKQRLIFVTRQPRHKEQRISIPRWPSKLTNNRYKCEDQRVTELYNALGDSGKPLSLRRA